VLCVDDGSTDGTADLLAAWAERDQRFRVLSLPHGGIIPALNSGLKACRGAIVARMDADDLASPERLALQAAYLDEHPEVDVVAGLVEGFPEGELLEGFRLYIEWLNSLVTHEQICREIFVESPLAHPSVTFRKEVVMRAGDYQEWGWPEDYDLWLRLYLAGARFAKIHEVLLRWREHPHRLTRTDSRYSPENFLRAKLHYLVRGPLADRQAVIIWGAGMLGRRLGKALLREGQPLVAYVDVDQRKIGRKRHGLPVLSPEELPEWWERYARPVVLAAVGVRGARELIRQRLNALGLVEGQDWWALA
jgi:glycosyltransferase involved in cell wall biosynthesis